MQVSTMSPLIIRRIFHGFFVGLTIIPSQGTGDESFGVNPNAAKARGNHEGDEQDDDENDAPAIWIGRRRGRIFEIGVHEIYHVGRRRLRAEGEVVDANKSLRHESWFIYSGRGERGTGGLQQPRRAKGSKRKGRFLNAGRSSFVGGARAMDLVGKFGWCDIRHGCGIPGTIPQGLPTMLESRGKWRKGFLEEGFPGGRVSSKKGFLEGWFPGEKSGGDMDETPPYKWVSTVSTIFDGSLQ